MNGISTSIKQNVKVSQTSVYNFSTKEVDKLKSIPSFVSWKKNPLFSKYIFQISLFIVCLSFRKILGEKKCKKDLENFQETKKGIDFNLSKEVNIFHSECA